METELPPSVAFVLGMLLLGSVGLWLYWHISRTGWAALIGIPLSLLIGAIAWAEAAQHLSADMMRELRVQAAFDVSLELGETSERLVDTLEQPPHSRSGPSRDAAHPIATFIEGSRELTVLLVAVLGVMTSCFLLMGASLGSLAVAFLAGLATLPVGIVAVLLASGVVIRIMR